MKKKKGLRFRLKNMRSDKQSGEQTKLTSFSFGIDCLLHLDYEVPYIGTTSDILETESVIRSIRFCPYNEGF